MRALGALRSQSCVLKSADDEREERARADASDAATPLPHLECGMYLRPDHLCLLLFRIMLHLLCFTEMQHDVWWFYSRKLVKHDRDASSFRLFANQECGPLLCCGAVAMVL